MNKQEQVTMSELFDKCIIKGDGTYKCPFGEWGVSCIDDETAMREAWHYFRTYCQDKPYVDRLNELVEYMTNEVV